jgi:DNA-directed RNA polymerase subunit F
MFVPRSSKKIIRFIPGMPAHRQLQAKNSDNATDLAAIADTLAKRVLRLVKRSSAINRPEDVNQLVNSMLQLMPLSDEQKVQIKDLLREEIADDIRSLLEKNLQRQRLLSAQAAERIRAQIIKASNPSDQAPMYTPMAHGFNLAITSLLMHYLLRPLVQIMVITINFAAEQTKQLLQLLARIFAVPPQSPTLALLAEQIQPAKQLIPAASLRPAATKLEALQASLLLASTTPEPIAQADQESSTATTPRPRLTPFRTTPF